MRNVLIALLAIVMVLIILIVLGYIFNWGWSGLGPYISPPHSKDSDFQRSKTLWDWLQLLIIPAVLAVAGYVINLTISRNEQEATNQPAQSEREAAEKRAETEREVTLDNQREETLQAYIDKMSQLLLHEGLRKSSEDAEVRRIATLQTLTALPRLDGKRKGSVLLFLHEAGLKEKSNPIIMFGAAGLHRADVRGCDLSGIAGASLYDGFISYAILDGADFTDVHLRGICFEGGSLCNARFISTDLRESEFFGTNLSGADLTGADLTNASLIAVNLTGTTVTNMQLDKAKSLQGATMPDGSLHP